MADEFIILRQETLQVLYRLRDASLHSLRGYANDVSRNCLCKNDISSFIFLIPVCHFFVFPFFRSQTLLLRD